MVSKIVLISNIFLLSTLLISSVGVLSASANSSASDTRPVSADRPAISDSRPTSKTISNPHWSGYADVYNNGSVSSVVASFTLPGVTCNSSSPDEQEMYFFAAMDNLITSNDFEYAGALAYCPLGSSTASYYAINTVNFTILTWTPKPGDKIVANITVTSGDFVYNVTDITSDQSTVVNASDSGATLNSAEVVTDTGNCGNSTVTVDCPLANFGRALFGFRNAGVKNTNYATIDGKTEAIGNFGTTVTLYRGVTTNEAGTVTDSITSAFAPGNSTFIVIYEHAGT
jgi:hypothetical protein